jgi:predicted TIM-barrel fold metal-dependent hydrolase
MPSDPVDFYADAIWQVTQHQLAARVTGASITAAAVRPEEPAALGAELLASDALLQTLQDIEALYLKQGRQGNQPVTTPDLLMSRVFATQPATAAAEDLGSLADATVATLKGFERSVKWLLKKVSRSSKGLWWDHAGNLLKFFFTMLAGEVDILRKLRATYRDVTGRRLFVHFMMDMEHSHREPNDPWYAYPTEQLQRMQKLAVQSNGEVVGFAAFNPRRPDAMDHVERALQMGFVGFKFYPPMRYKPIGNKDPDIDSRVEQFFERCIADDIPVFAHCTPRGFEARKGAGLNADPTHWRRRLEKDGFERLRLCLAHAGGDRTEVNKRVYPGWDAKSNEWADKSNYAHEVVALCREFENVYCEIGHLHGVLEDAGKARRFRANLLREWTAPGAYSLSTKMMYGSDWHMPSMIDDTDDYLRFFQHLFAEPVLSQDRDAFFAGNALRFMALDKLARRTNRLSTPVVSAHMAQLAARGRAIGDALA